MRTSRKENYLLHKVTQGTLDHEFGREILFDKSEYVIYYISYINKIELPSAMVNSLVGKIGSRDENPLWWTRVTTSKYRLCEAVHWALENSSAKKYIRFGVKLTDALQPDSRSYNQKT